MIIKKYVITVHTDIVKAYCKDHISYNSIYIQIQPSLHCVKHKTVHKFILYINLRYPLYTLTKQLYHDNL